MLKYSQSFDKFMTNHLHSYDKQKMAKYEFALNKTKEYIMSAPKMLFKVIILSLIVFASGMNSYSQTKVRVGTYDSRLIAVAYYNSKLFKIPSEVREKMKVAQEKNDTVTISAITKEMPLRQRYMHEQAFGKASVCYLIEEIKDKVAEYVKKEKLDFIVSKWEMSFINPNYEVVDITLSLANLFEPSMDMGKMMTDLNSNEPVKDAFLIDD
ncbi:MAG: hypothetical protein NTY74_04560 [Ignavibacteriae bacterium]|nr:hypothetical protein [Ignavibacteriota bacterium]